jgi:hypothetical protein
MRTYVSTKQEKSQALHGSPKVSRQASAHDVLQACKDKIVQRQELDEDELLQGKFETAQREEIDEDDLLQGKFNASTAQHNTAQRESIPEDEEMLQGKFQTAQEEILQGRFMSSQQKNIQRQKRIDDLEQNVGEDYNHIWKAACGKDTSANHHDPSRKKDRPKERVGKYSKKALDERFIRAKEQTLKRLRKEEKMKKKPEEITQLFGYKKERTLSNSIQIKPNNTGLPDNLKNGIESLSGYSMDDVRVHYNSPKPAQLQALAYTQGTNIHVAPGQERHLPHEAWHVVQQMQGRVQPTMQLQGVNVNDDAGLEHEADVMGGKAVQMKILTPVDNE